MSCNKINYTFLRYSLKTPFLSMFLRLTSGRKLPSPNKHLIPQCIPYIFYTMYITLIAYQFVEFKNPRFKVEKICEYVIKITF